MIFVTSVTFLCIRPFPLHDSPRILTVRLMAWMKELGAVRDWYQHEHANWLPLSGDNSKWLVWNRAKEIALSSVQQQQAYLTAIGDGKCTTFFFKFFSEIFNVANLN